MWGKKVGETQAHKRSLMERLTMAGLTQAHKEKP